MLDAGSTPAASTTFQRNTMRITKRQLKSIIREEYSRLKRRGLIREANYNYMWPWNEVAPYFEDQGFKVKKAHAGPRSGSATFVLPVTDPRGTKSDLGYFVFAEYDNGIFRFRWMKRDHKGEYPYRGIFKPGGGKWMWEIDHTDRAIKTAVDEIVYEITAHDAEGINPIDMQYNKKW